MKLHLGSGKVKLDGWLNIDLEAPEADLHLDLTQALPFEDESAKYIFNEHFIEHVIREKALGLLRECHRVLAKGGVLRLSTPNLKFLAICYLSRNIDEWEGLWHPKNPCHLMNEGMRSWGHEFLYDAEELVRLLHEAGFSHIEFVNWRKSSNKELCDLETRPYHEELIIEATKTPSSSNWPKVVADPNKEEQWLSRLHQMLHNRIIYLEQSAPKEIRKDFKVSQAENVIGKLTHKILNLSKSIRTKK